MLLVAWSEGLLEEGFNEEMQIENTRIAQPLEIIIETPRKIIPSYVNHLITMQKTSEW